MAAHCQKLLRKFCIKFDLERKAHICSAKKGDNMFNKKISAKNEAVKILLTVSQRSEVIAKLKAYRDEAAAIKDVGSQRMFDLVSKIRMAEIDLVNVLVKDENPVLNVSDSSFDIDYSQEKDKEIVLS